MDYEKNSSTGWKYQGERTEHIAWTRKLKEVQWDRRRSVKTWKWLMTKKLAKEMEQHMGLSPVTTQGDKGSNIKSDKGEGKCEGADLNRRRGRGKKHLK